jgi:hypothetical protein
LARIVTHARLAASERSGLTTGLISQSLPICFAHFAHSTGIGDCTGFSASGLAATFVAALPLPLTFAGAALPFGLAAALAASDVCFRHNSHPFLELVVPHDAASHG